MHPHHVAQPPKLHPALVLGAEPQRRHGRAVVEPLQLGVALEYVQHGAVHLPQELERGEQHGRLALGLLRVGGHGRQEDGLGVAIVDHAPVVVGLRGGRGVPVPPRGGGRGGRLLPPATPLGRLLRVPALLLGLLDEVPYHPLQTSRRLALAEVAVLVQPVLGLARPAELEAQVQVKEDDLLVRGGPRLVPPAAQYLVEEGQRGLRLGDGVELRGPPEGVLGLVQERVVVRHGGVLISFSSERQERFSRTGWGWGGGEGTAPKGSSNEDPRSRRRRSSSGRVVRRCFSL